MSIMETLLATLLVASSLLHIFRFMWDRHEQKMKKLESDEPPISIPVASDARFLRLQVRNPSWTKVYQTINKAISNGEDSCAIRFDVYRGEPKIPFKELKSELEALGYSVKRYVELEDCDDHFIIKWG